MNAVAGAKQQSSFFKTLYDGGASFDAEQFLVEVGSIFPSSDIREEVRWRLEVLREISNHPDLIQATEGLKKRLTQIFSTGGEEGQVLQRLRDLTEVDGANGSRVDLRRFLKRSKRLLPEQEYRELLQKKLENTETHLINLTALYPETTEELRKLMGSVRSMRIRLEAGGVRTADIKTEEDNLRRTNTFQLYEDLKTRFLRDWLARFTTLTPAEIAGMTVEEVQHLIQEHQRHQLEELAQCQVAVADQDMTEHLSVHDTLECEFREQAFWEGASGVARSSFRQWILSTIHAFGMLKGNRHVLFQNQSDKDQFLLFGLGISSLPPNNGDQLQLVPYIKPFARKSNYLLEVRRRDIGDVEAYYHELLHYLLPFLHAFEQMADFMVMPELVEFLNSRY